MGGVDALPRPSRDQLELKPPPRRVQLVSEGDGRRWVEPAPLEADSELDAGRKVVAVSGWSCDAVAVPTEELPLV